MALLRRYQQPILDEGFDFIYRTSNKIEFTGDMLFNVMATVRKNDAEITEFYKSLTSDAKSDEDTGIVEATGPDEGLADQPTLADA
jgi:hypothetical protein